MGIMTDNLQMINRTLQDETSKKTTKKESKENYINFLFFEFWNNFVKAENKKDIYLYYKDPVITKKYIQLKYEDFGQDKDGYNKLILFNNLTIPEKMNIYDDTLKKVYNRFKLIEEEEEKEQKQKEKRKQELLKIIEKQEKELAKVNSQIEKYNTKYQKELEKRNKTHINGANKILAGLFIGGKVASKTWKNNFYKGLK